MTNLNEISDRYVTHMQERKHEAWMRFKNSGYKDHEAHKEFVALYDKLNAYWNSRYRRNLVGGMQ